MNTASRRPRRMFFSRPFFAALALLLLVGGLLALGTSGCEAVLGTGNLKDGIAGSDGGHGGDDDDDGDDASVQTDGGHLTGDATTPDDGSVLDSGDGGGNGGEGGSSDAGPPISSLPSCVTSKSANTCGVTTDQDCCANKTVAGATYYRTFDGGSVADSVTVSKYNLDVYEVTVGRMRAYATWLASDAGAAPAGGAGKHSYLNGGDGLVLENDIENGIFAFENEPGWSTSNNTNLTLGSGANAAFAAPPQGCGTTYSATDIGNENKPVNCVDWYDAYAFCIWDKGFLPTESEWELAAVAGTQQRPYPWGTAALASNEATYGCSETTGCPKIVGTPAGGNGLYGQLDLIGSVAEWTLDDFESSYFDTDDCTDCFQSVTGGGSKVDRGGGFNDLASGSFLSPQYRSEFTPVTHNQVMGFRCARPPTP